MQSNITVAQIKNKMWNSIWGMLISDALCMPVHWYYNIEKMKEDFGYLTSYQDPKPEHPTSVMKLPDTNDPTIDIIGKFVLHSKRDLYKKQNPHYHDGLKAGDLTMNSDILKITMNCMIKNIDNPEGSYNLDLFLIDYVQFLMTPGTHNDSYLDSCHMMFIQNHLKGKPYRQCTGAENKDTPCALAEKLVTPVLFGALLDYIKINHIEDDQKLQVPIKVYNKCISDALTHLAILFEGDQIRLHCESYCRTLLNVILGKDLKTAIIEDGDKVYGFDFPKIANLNKPDDVIAHTKFHIRCYTDGSLPLGYYLAYKYSDNFEKAILSNCNIGGENLSRGAIVGALVAAQNENLTRTSKWILGIKRNQEFEDVISKFLNKKKSEIFVPKL